MKCLVLSVVATFPTLAFSIRATKVLRAPGNGTQPRRLERRDFGFDETPIPVNLHKPLRVDAPKSMGERYLDAPPQRPRIAQPTNMELTEVMDARAVVLHGMAERQRREFRAQVNSFIGRVYEANENMRRGDVEIAKILLAYDHENTNRQFEQCQNAANQRYELRMQHKARTSHKEHEWHLEHQQKLIALDATRKRWANNDAMRDHYLDAYHRRLQNNMRAALADDARLAELNTRVAAQIAIEQMKTDSQLEALHLQARIREKEQNELGRQAALQRKHALDQDLSRREDEKLKRGFALKRARQVANDRQRMLNAVQADQRYRAQMLDRRAARERGNAHALATTDALLASNRAFNSYRSSVAMAARNHDLRMQMQSDRHALAMFDAESYRQHAEPAGLLSALCK